MTWSRLALALTASLSLVACAAEQAPAKKTSKKTPATQNDANDDDQAAEEAPAFEAPKVAFTFKACSGNYAEATACGTASVPLDWSQPNGKKIELFVARLGEGKAKTQLFMVQGGPGGSADALVMLGKMVREKRLDVDVFFVEHRGVGRSTRLACATAEQPAFITPDEAAGCAAELKRQWGDGLSQFTTSNAARDLATAVTSLRPEGGKAFVYGVSYGTYWVHRLLKLAPKVADGAILDSAVPPTGATFDQFDAQGDPVLKRLGEVCKRSAACSQNLGADPFATMSRIIGSFDSARCATALGVDRMWLRGQVFGMLQRADIAALVPSFLVRLSRCSSTDQQAVRSFFQAVNAEQRFAGVTAELPEGDLGSGALYNNVVFSEIWATPAPTQATLKSRIANLVLTTGGSQRADGTMEDQVVGMDRARTAWPAYARDEHVGKWATTDIPVLTLNGDLDVQTPIETARLYEANLKGAGKNFVFVPFANHGVIFQSATRDGTPCGLRIVVDFLSNPTKPSTTCTSTVLTPDVDVAPDIARFVYKTNTGFGAAFEAEVTAEAEAPELGARPVLSDEAVMESPRVKRFLENLRLSDRLAWRGRPLGLPRH